MMVMWFWEASATFLFSLDPMYDPLRNVLVRFKLLLRRCVRNSHRQQMLKRKPPEQENLDCFFFRLDWPLLTRTRGGLPFGRMVDEMHMSSTSLKRIRCRSGKTEQLNCFHHLDFWIF